MFELSDSEDRITHDAVRNGTRLLPRGAVVFVVRGMSLANEFRVGVTTREVAFNQDLRAIIPSSDIDGRFLAQYLKARERVILGLTDNASHGTKRLPTELVEAIQVPVPPLPEQRRIATILDKADAIRRKREEGIRLTEELLRSTFLGMFGDPATNPKGWAFIMLGELIAEGPQNGLYRPSSDYGSGIRIVRIDGFRGGDHLTPALIEKRLRIDDSTRATYQLRDGDLLINRVNSRSHLGKAAVVYTLQEQLVYESNMMRLSLKPDRALPHYVLACLGEPFLVRQIQTAAKDAVNQASINQSDVKSLLLPLPPMCLQERFSKHVISIFAASQSRREALDRHGELFASLVQRAFRGEL
jgi:type I restriction enzyme S subunit